MGAPGNVAYESDHAESAANNAQLLHGARRAGTNCDGAIAGTGDSPRSDGAGAKSRGRAWADQRRCYDAACSCECPPSAGERRTQLRHKIDAATLATYRRRGEWRSIRTNCVVPSPVTTPTGAVFTQRRTSVIRRRITSPAVLPSITLASLCSGMTPLSSTLPRVNVCHW